MTQEPSKIKQDKSEPYHQKLLNYWAYLLEESTFLEYKPGQFIFYEGHQPCGIYLLLSGEVDLIKSQDKKPHSMGTFPLLNVMGMDLLLMGKAYPFSAIARTIVKISFVNKDMLLETQNGRNNHS